MPPPSSHRRATLDTAAYSASQPLFDAIRHSADAIDEQKQHLLAAKDAVRQLHVTLPSEHVGIERVTRADYIDALVAGWRSTTDSYQRIFAELCHVTGPDPATGRAAEDDHDIFQKLQNGAMAANAATFRYVLGAGREKRKAEVTNGDGRERGFSSPTPAKKTKKTGTAQAAREATTTVLMSAKRSAPSDTSPTQAQFPSAKRQRIAEIDATVTAEAAQPSRKTSMKRVVRRQRASQKKQAAEHRQQQHNNGTTDPATHTPQPPAAPEPQVQYEDVSAEVDARLAAKEEKKRAKKEARKRKRDSLGSAVVEAEVGAEQEALDARDRDLAQKPAKKRSKSATGEAVRMGEVDLPERGKRRSEHGSGDAVKDGNGEGRKKRRKSK